MGKGQGPQVSAGLLDRFWMVLAGNADRNAQEGRPQLLWHRVYQRCFSVHEHRLDHFGMLCSMLWPCVLCAAAFGCAASPSQLTNYAFFRDLSDCAGM